VAPAAYDPHLACVNNLENGGYEEVVADIGGRELVRANRTAADDADVSDLDEDIENLKRVWLRSGAQTLDKGLIGSVPVRVPPRLQALAIAGAFSNHAQDLGFEPGRGLYGNPAMKIHVVGHTHMPEATAPELSEDTVEAQHVNTGTGFNVWHAHDAFQFDFFDLGQAGSIDLGFFRLGPLALAVESSRDRLSTVSKSRYCLIQPVPTASGILIRVEGGEYRDLQAGDPVNTATSGIRGRLGPGIANYVRP
jgi:hypothetical protein